MSNATLMVLGGFLLIAIMAALCVFRSRERLNTPVRILISVLCVPVALFCVFGFMASFEPGIVIAWKIGYAALFATMLATAAAPWLRVRDSADCST